MFSETRRVALGLLSCLAFAACSDSSRTSSPTAPTDLDAPAQAQTGVPTLDGGLAIPITRTVRDVATGATGVFEGTLTITSFALNSFNQLVANGTIVGQTTIRGVTTAVNQSFTGLRVIQQQRRCEILNLDIGPIFLNLLGLEVRTSRITIDVTAVEGPGNLLGNLLCAIASLLDSPLTGGALAAIQDLLDQINDILAGA